MTRATGFALLAAVVALWQLPLARAAQAPTAPMEALDVARLRHHQERLANAVASLPRRAPLAELIRLTMQPMDEQATTDGAVDDNRAALVAIAFYVNGWPLAAVVPDARDWPRPAGRTLLLRGRADLAQHFTVSALIAAFAGAPLANLAGLYKEMNDARGDSGFSFPDLAADRAGTLFGDRATRSRESAWQLRSRIRAGVTEADMMPVVDDLPGNLSRAELTNRYGGIGAPAYNQLVEEIDRRVAALPLFQSP